MLKTMEISNRITISKENPKRGMDQKIPQIGSSVKRKRLSDITNTVGPTRSTAQIQDNPKEIACAITKECVSQLLEENAMLLKTIGERNKYLELSSIELQKLRVVVGKANVQNRNLAQANSQMFAELTTSKERLKALQHELGCTVAVVKLKNKELEEKEKLIKELRKMIRVEDKKPNGELHEKRAVEDCSNFKDIAADASVSNTINDTTCNTKKRAVRNKHTVDSNAPTNQEKPKEKSVNQRHEKAIAEEELNGGLCEEIRTEEHLHCVNPTTTDASLPGPVDSNINCGPNIKHILRSQSLGRTTSTQAKAKKENNTTLTQLEEAKEKNNTRTSIRRSNIRKPEPLDSKDYSTNIVDTEIPGATTLTETKEKINRRTSMRRSSNTKAEPLESKDHLIDIADTEIPASTSLVEAKEKTKTRTSTRRLSDNRQSEPLDSKDYLTDIVDTEIPGATTLTETKEKSNRRTSMRRSSNTKAEPLESKDHLIDIDDTEIPAGTSLVEAKEKTKTRQSEPLDSKDYSTEIADTEIPGATTLTETKEKINRRTSTRRSSNTKAEPLESKDHLIDIADTIIPANTRRTSSRRLSNNRQSESVELKDRLFEIVDPEFPACSLDEEQPVQAESSDILTQQVEDKEKDDKGGRKSSRRSSNSQIPDTYESEDSNETAIAQPPACSPVVESPSKVDPLYGKPLASSYSDTFVKLIEDQKEQSSSSQCHDQESRRISVGRPTRRAAEKVSSYKERPLNVKMRRPE